MDNLTENAKVTADGAEAEKDKNAAAALGKFKDVQTLFKAYNDLEAEFTRRSQRLKELEKENKAEAAPSPVSEEQILHEALSNTKVRDAVIEEYLKGVSNTQGVPLVTGGGGVAAPRAVPKSVKEAGKLAQQYLNK